jgi:anti-anti-sigma regulatory factor
VYQPTGRAAQADVTYHEGLDDMGERLLARKGGTRGAVPAQRTAVRRVPPVVVSPLGPLTGGRVELFRRRLALLSVHPDAEVVVDLAAVPSLDARAAQSLLDARARLGRGRGRLRILHLGSQPAEALAALTSGVRGDGRLVSRRGW